MQGLAPFAQVQPDPAAVGRVDLAEQQRTGGEPVDHTGQGRGGGEGAGAQVGHGEFVDTGE
ncbi:Uncharacterised protein [Mycobacteroides abscessus subsp. abscessus]|nr:Uncharacterised protein [Mycobacteroides abscessus subsp. abscessus]